jgi:hypothetical protein
MWMFVDLIYQTQWKLSPVNEQTIAQFLAKVKNHFWVMDECMVRRPMLVRAVIVAVCVCPFKRDCLCLYCPVATRV